MKNRHAGFLIIATSIVIAILVLIFNIALKDIIGATCSHGASCGMYDSVKIQTWIGITMAALVFIIGLFLVLTKESEKIVIKRVKERQKTKKLDLTGLDKDEKAVINLLQDENGAIFQRTLMEKLEIGKVKVTRLLDKLEAKQFIERKRRGMNNIVVLKQ